MQPLLLVVLAACGTPDPAARAPEPAPAAKAEPPANALIAAGTIQAPDDAPQAVAVFVSVRAPERPGPPLAARRLPPGPFPLAFELTEAHRPMAVGDIPAEFQLKVTLDVDGNPMTPSDGDLSKTLTVARGARDVVVDLAAE
ncbi:MAG: hypothetical protein AAF211_18025 [Myxococcota bacterium]